MSYRAPVADMAFTLEHAAGLGRAREEGLLEDLARDDVEAILDEAAKFATDIIAPLNAVGDRHGTPFKDGVIAMPPGWKDAYRAWTQAGWNAVSAPAQWGGQALPQSVNAACTEMWNSAALAFGLGPLLTMHLQHARLHQREQTFEVFDCQHLAPVLVDDHFQVLLAQAG